MISKDTLITVASIMFFSLLMLAIGFAAGWRKAQVDQRPSATLQQLQAEADSLEALSDSLVVALESSKEESVFWQLQTQITNELLANNQAAIDSFNRLNPQRHAQRNKMAVAAAAQLDSFFAARYTAR